MNTKQLAEKLVSWIKEKVTSGGCRGTVLGLSGGIDSSVLAVICQLAFPQNTLGLIMPCESSPADKEHALELAEKFSIPTTEVTLDEIYASLLRTLPDYQPASPSSLLARANLKPRLRMLNLYYIASQLNYMVAGSSNRCELALGYFTKYGDGGVDIIPLGSLVKGQIRELAVYLGIPKSIIDKPPSAGLWAGQTDEAEMGISYQVLDRYLLGGNVSGDIRSKIELLMSASEHKRSMPPIADF